MQPWLASELDSNGCILIPLIVEDPVATLGDLGDVVALSCRSLMRFDDGFDEPSTGVTLSA
jgi:hypothetical protein